MSVMIPYFSIRVLMPYNAINMCWGILWFTNIKYHRTVALARTSSCLALDSTLSALCIQWCYINTLRPKQNGRHFTDDIFKCIFLNENDWISLKISLKFVPKGPINNIPALVQIMAWRRPGGKPLSEPMIVSLPTHICVTRPQWVMQC